jgi:hypothetical protein
MDVVFSKYNLLDADKEYNQRFVYLFDKAFHYMDIYHWYSEGVQHEG